MKKLFATLILSFSMVLGGGISHAMIDENQVALGGITPLTSPDVVRSIYGQPDFRKGNNMTYRAAHGRGLVFEIKKGKVASITAFENI